MTTNSIIKNESFFNPTQIKVIDEVNPEIDFDWIKDKTTFPVDSGILKLELSVWLKSVFGLETQKN
jgi:predicted RNA-binding protein